MIKTNMATVNQFIKTKFVEFIQQLLVDILKYKMEIFKEIADSPFASEEQKTYWSNFKTK